MKVSLNRLSQLLDSPIGAEEADEVLMSVGFPVEAQVPVMLSDGGDDLMLDVEVTSNRSDCLSHVGIARELSAATPRTLKLPAIELPVSKGPGACDLIQLTCEADDLCSLYTARVIRGIRVGPSPAWLINALEAIGMRSVNNVVDVTNFVLMEWGQPLHAFDLAKLQGPKIIVRRAAAGESFVALDESKHTLTDQILVIADEKSPVALAGIMGGLTSEVGLDTADILLESAMFNPLSVRSTSRALKLSSESSYRFERGVDPQGVDRASRRAAQLIVELAGGELAEGVVSCGKVNDQPRQVTMRVARCQSLLGESIPADEQMRYLEGLELSPTLKEDQIICTVPTFRLDLFREVDLIEEVARSRGLDDVPVRSQIEVQIRPVQPTITAGQKLAEVMVAHGYHETITPTFLEPKYAQAMQVQNSTLLSVDPQRRKVDPILRPSVLVSLLICRKFNQDRGNVNVKLFEIASVWAPRPPKQQTHEQRVLSMIGDATDKATALREIKGVLAAAVDRLGGELTFEPVDDPRFEVAARIMLDHTDCGRVGVIAPSIQMLFELQTPVVAAEVDHEPLLAHFPPKREVTRLARFPGIERDLSIVVEEPVAWQSIEQAVRHAKPAMLESITLLGIYRGKPIAKGQKSVSFRMQFADPNATLRHDQVDPQIESVVRSLKQTVNATLRT